MKTQHYLGLSLMIITALVLTSFQVEAAHFVCGYAYDATDGTSSMGRMVLIYSSTPSHNVTCIVEGANQYCCDAQAVPGQTWSSGKVYYLFVDMESDAYSSDTVSVTTTPAGFDMAPAITLDSAVAIISPAGNTTYSQNSLILNITSGAGFTVDLGYAFNGSADISLCTSCSQASVNLTNLSDGNYTLSAFSNHTRGTTARLSVSFLIDAVNDAPQIDEVSPDSETVNISETESTTFTLNVSDPNSYSTLQYWWYSDGEYAGTGTSLSIESNYAGDYSAGVYNITVIAGDGEFNVSRSWTLSVIDVPGHKDIVHKPGEVEEIEVIELEKTVFDDQVLFSVVDQEKSVQEVTLTGDTSADLVFTYHYSKPWWIDYPLAQDAYAFFELETEPADWAGDISLTFHVDNDWLKRKGFGVDDIYLDHFKENGINRITPHLIRQDETYAVYTADVTHLSLFVVVGDPSEKAVVDDTPSQPVEKPEEIRDEPADIPDTEPPSEEIPSSLDAPQPDISPLLNLFVVGMLFVASTVYILRKEKKVFKKESSPTKTGFNKKKTSAKKKKTAGKKKKTAKKRKKVKKRKKQAVGRKKGKKVPLKRTQKP